MPEVEGVVETEEKEKEGFDFNKLLVTFLQKVKNTPMQFLVSIGFVILVVMIVVPLPGFMLDILLAVNISFSVMVFMTTIYIKKPTEFSIFPSMLLITTLFRLALNVSSTRLILSLGKAFNSQIIKAFGSFVVRGDYVVGFIIFLVLIIIQLVVITRGATRISEVAARFALDKMPVANLAIDSQLQQGLITEEQARAMRKELEKEMEFYGAMDGASRFVQGDAIAGLIITMIDIIGGFIIGVAFKKYTFAESAKTYMLLTVGDGLVSQVPALLISIAAGIIISRGRAEEKALSQEVLENIAYDEKVLFIASGFAASFALIPDFPKIPFLLVAGILAFGAWQMRKARLEREKAEELMAKQLEEKKRKEEQAKKVKIAPTTPKEVVSLDLVEIDIGYNLIPLVAREHGGDLPERIKLLRRQLAEELGFVIPPVRIRDNLNLHPNKYVIKIKGVKVVEGLIFPDRMLAIPQMPVAEIEGIEDEDPVNGIKVYWISPEDVDKAEEAGYLVVDPTTVFITRLSEVLRRKAYKLLTLEDVKEIVEAVRERYPTLVGEVEAEIPLKVLHKVLVYLLMERVSIKNAALIFEAILDTVEKGDFAKIPEVLVEFIRIYLGPQIVDSLAINGVLYYTQLSMQTYDELEKYKTQNQYGLLEYQLPPDIAEKFLSKFSLKYTDMVSKYGVFVLITRDFMVRRAIRMMVENYYPDANILSIQEIEQAHVELQLVDEI